MKHAQSRGMERQGKRLSVLDLTNLRFIIEQKPNVQAWFYKNGTNGTTQKWIVKYKEKLLYVVFDPKSRKIVTILDDPHPDIIARTVKEKYEEQ